MLGSVRINQQKNEFFNELKFQHWKVYPAIPSEDIVWQNAANLMKKSSCSNFMGYLSPILTSSLVIIILLSIEAMSLHYVPWLSTIILYVTTTMLVIFSFYVTPYLVFNSMQNEKLAQKSHCETAYMRRLMIVEILNVFIIPVVFNIILVKWLPDGYRGNFHDHDVLDQGVATIVDIIAF